MLRIYVVCFTWSVYVVCLYIYVVCLIIICNNMV